MLVVRLILGVMAFAGFVSILAIDLVVFILLTKLVDKATPIMEKRILESRKNRFIRSLKKSNK